MVIELFAINRDTWKCNRRIIIDETSIWNVKKRKKENKYHRILLLNWWINFSIFMILNEFNWWKEYSGKFNRSV